MFCKRKEILSNLYFHLNKIVMISQLEKNSVVILGDKEA